MKILNYFAILIVVLNGSSCMVAGAALGGKTETSEKTYEMENENNQEENITKLKQSLYSLGWIKVSESGNMLIFSKKGTISKELLFSKIEDKRIIAVVVDNRVQLEIIQHGNFKTGTVNSIDKTYELIKVLLD